jgi:hypothetical protein
MQKERRKESHTQGGYYLSVADCIYFGGMEASCFWLSSCVLMLGLQNSGVYKNQRKVRWDLGCATILCVRARAMDLRLGGEFSGADVEFSRAL